MKWTYGYQGKGEGEEIISKFGVYTLLYLK